MKTIGNAVLLTCVVLCLGCLAQPAQADPLHDLMGKIIKGETAVRISGTNLRGTPASTRVERGESSGVTTESFRARSPRPPFSKTRGTGDLAAIPARVTEDFGSGPAPSTGLDAILHGSAKVGETRRAPGKSVSDPGSRRFPTVPLELETLIGALGIEEEKDAPARTPKVKAKALLCLDCSRNRVVLAHNVDKPLPIASITKLLTAMVVADRMNLDQVVEVPSDIRSVPRHKVGIRPGDRIKVKDLLHGLLIESGNDCAEVLARTYPQGGKGGFVRALNTLASRLGAAHTTIRTPSGLDMRITIGRKQGREFEAKRSNVASARDVALIAEKAFEYPLIREISTLKRYSFKTLNAKPRTYNLWTNDRLLAGKLPVEGAKTGYTDAAGRCIVARFKDDDTNYMVVVLNTRHHFRAAEKIYRWASNL